MDLGFVVFSSIDSPEIKEAVQGSQELQKTFSEALQVIVQSVAQIIGENKGNLEKQIQKLVLILKPLKTVLGHLINPQEGISKAQR